MTDTSPPTPKRDVILVGGSQGAIPAVKLLLRGLPANLHARICITIHRSPTFHPGLAQLFAKHTTMPVADATHGELFGTGRVYLAPPDHHLLLRGGALWLDRGPKLNHVRPAIDPMFFSGAKAYGRRVIGVLLTGNLSDGVAGLVGIKQRGGLSLAQDPNEAEAPSMPMNAIAFDDVDAIFPMATASSLLRDLAEGRSVSEVIASDGAKHPPERGSHAFPLASAAFLRARR